MAKSMRLGKKIGEGGEAAVYEVAHDPNLVGKIYHAGKCPPLEKLQAMIAAPPDDPARAQGHISIAWMTELVSEHGQVIGYLMPKISGGIPVHKLYNPKDRKQDFPGFTWQYLHRTARNLASAVAAIHAKGYVIGDLNESNILVQPTAMVTLIDTDSFQVQSPQGQIFRCHVGKPEYVAPEIQGKNLSTLDRTEDHDRFALAVILFQLLMENCHPFAGSGEPPELASRIRSGFFPYAPDGSAATQPPSWSLPFAALHPEIQQRFYECFHDGHFNPHNRPPAVDWSAALKKAEAELVQCSHNRNHWYGRTQRQCTWCERTKQLQGNDPFPDKAQPPSQPKTTVPTQQPLPAIHVTPPPRPIVTQQPQRQPTPPTPAPPRPAPAPTQPTYRQPVPPGTQPQSQAWKWVVGVLVAVIGIWVVSSRQPTPVPVTPQPLSSVAPSPNQKNQVEPLTGMELVWIEGGCFQMGTTDGNVAEKPMHRVCVDEFWMGKYEVTQAQWQKVMGNNPSNFKGANNPVEKVSWDDAQEFLRQVNQQAGQNPPLPLPGGEFRMPTEAEWEYACRAGTQTAYSFGDDAARLGDYAWYSDNSGVQTHPVGQKKPNGWGLYDMHGNVWEWASDWYAENYYANSPEKNPQGPDSGKYRLLRGGSWYNQPSYVRCADRSYNSPANRYFNIGLRLVVVGARTP